MPPRGAAISAAASEGRGRRRVYKACGSSGNWARTPPSAPIFLIDTDGGNAKLVLAPSLRTVLLVLRLVPSLVCTAVVTTQCNKFCRTVSVRVCPYSSKSFLISYHASINAKSNYPGRSGKVLFELAVHGASLTPMLSDNSTNSNLPRSER